MRIEKRKDRIYIYFEESEDFPKFMKFLKHYDFVYHLDDTNLDFYVDYNKNFKEYILEYYGDSYKWRD